VEVAKKSYAVGSLDKAIVFR